MTVLSKPLDIGAHDLLRGVDDISYYGFLDVLTESKFGSKKWKPRYVIISQGCVYVYTDHNAKKPVQSFSLSHILCVEECDPDGGEDINFCLRYKHAQAPMMFSCDTKERMKKWTNKLSLEITRVLQASKKVEHSPLNNLSADSGFGSAGTEFLTGGYDEVNEGNINKAASPSQISDNEYEEPICSGSPTCYDRKTVHSRRHTPKMEHCDSKAATLNELKMALGKRNKAKILEKPTTDDLTLLDRPRNQPIQAAAPSHFQDLMPSISCASSFVDVRSGDWSISIDGSNMEIADEGLYVNQNISNGSSESGNTSPKLIYENPMELHSTEQHKFKEHEYFLDGEDSVKSLFKEKGLGTFAVRRGGSTPYQICVVTPYGLKYFRLYEQNGKVSLFPSHQINTFDSLDELLSHYRTTDLPRADYKVKLLRGFNSNINK